MWVAIHNPNNARCTQDKYDCSGRLEWDDGTPFTVHDYLNVWVNDGQDCVRFRDNLILDDRPCSSSFNALCQSDCTRECKKNGFLN